LWREKKNGQALDPERSEVSVAKGTAFMEILSVQSILWSGYISNRITCKTTFFPTTIHRKYKSFVLPMESLPYPTGYRTRTLNLFAESKIKGITILVHGKIYNALSVTGLAGEFNCLLKFANPKGD